MAEKQLKIKATDGKIISGTYTPARHEKGLIIFVHGFTGHQNEHIYYNAARYFPKRGFSTFRFDLYPGEKNHREMVECTLITHAKDLDRVIAVLRKKHRSIFLVGHSFGGPTILKADTSKIKTIVFWDPAFELRWLTYAKHIPRRSEYRIDWGVSFLIGRKMVEQAKTLRSAPLLEKLTIPVKVIFAEHGNKANRPYVSHIKSPHSSCIIARADHCFNVEGTEDLLFKETLSWINKYTRSRQ
jgi:dienelactone hydrolase